MSRLVGTIVTVPYIGQFFSQPVKWCEGRIVPMNLNWATYWGMTAQATLGVAFNLIGNGATPEQIDAIRSIKIDNTQSANPVTIIFEDGDVITAAPFTTVVANPFTNSWQGVVIMDNLSAGSLPLTRIEFMSFYAPPVVIEELATDYPQWRGSPLIQRNQSNILTSGFASPALGDQTQQVTIDMKIPNDSQNLFGTPYSTGFIYLTCLVVNFVGTNSNSGSLINLLIESTGTAGTLFNIPGYISNAAGSISGIINALSLTGMQLRLDATQQWRARNPAGPGGINLTNASVIVVYTYNPN